MKNKYLSVFPCFINHLVLFFLSNFFVYCSLNAINKILPSMIRMEREERGYV